MNFDNLRAFYTVARYNSLHKGAEELGTSSIELEKTITAFEKETKAILFNRRHEIWTLTLQGHFLFRKARTILSEVESIRSVLEENETGEISGTLKVVTTHGLASLWISQYLSGFLETYPGIRLAIHSQDKEIDVTLGEGDIAIRTLVPNGQGIIQHYIMTWHVALYASPLYLKKFGAPKSIEDLDNHRLITLGHENIKPYKDVNWLLTIGKKPDEMPREPYLRIQSLQGLVDCTLDGIGIASVSRELPIVKQGRLIRILPEIKGPEVDIFFIYPQILSNSKKVLALRDYLVMKARERSGIEEKVFVH